MTVSAFDSPLLARGFSDPGTARFFTDAAQVRAMLLVWAALARAQAAHGLIPSEAADAIHRAAREAQVDPGALAEAVERDGTPIPAVLAAFRREVGDSGLAAHVHHGATSQDVVDTGLALRLRPALARIAERLDAALAALATLAEAHAETPMAARSWGQPATPTTFGATVAIWGEGLLAMRRDLPRIRDLVLVVTLNGAAGTLARMGEAGPRIRADLAAALDLGMPDGARHADRAAIRALGSWLHGTIASADKMATDLLLLARDGSVVMGAGGGSSTMPQKANPVGASRMRALAIHGAGLASTLAATHWDARDGAAWMAEWLTLPPLVVATARALDLAATLDIRPDADRLRAPLDDPGGLIHAEAAAFALPLPLPEAQARVKALAEETRAEGGSLLARAGLDPAAFAPEAQWGEAPALARAFAARVRDAGCDPSTGRSE